MKQPPDIRSYPLLLNYINLQGQLVAASDQDQRKSISWSMIAFARDAIQQAKEFNLLTAEALKANQIEAGIYREGNIHDAITISSLPYTQFAIISEKEGNITQAVWACQQALDLGLTDDGTKGGMHGRLDRLLKKV